MKRPMERNLSRARALAIALAVSLPTLALAQDVTPEAQAGDELIERTVVRNRLYSSDGRFELGLNVGFTLLTRLTEHYNFNASAGYNISETFAVELRGGYAYSRHTGLARQIADDFAANTSIREANDLADLWEMNANAIFGVRWQPIYGKISLLAELPVHYQFYLWLGGGAGQFQRESLVFCTSPAGGTACDAFLQETKVAPIGSAALGARVFLTPKQSLRLEVRDFSYPDSYLVGIQRAGGLASGGTPATSPGITNLVMLDVGYSFLF